MRLLQMQMSLYVMSHTEVEILDDGGLRLVELSPVDPWLADPREPLELQEGEVKVCIPLVTHSILYTRAHIKTTYFLFLNLHFEKLYNK